MSVGAEHSVRASYRSRRGTDSIQRRVKTGASFCVTSSVSVMWKRSAVAWIVRSDVDVVVPEGRTMRARVAPERRGARGVVAVGAHGAGERAPYERRVVHAHVALDDDLDLGTAAEGVARDTPRRRAQLYRRAARRPPARAGRRAASRCRSPARAGARGARASRAASQHLARGRLGRRPDVRPVGVGHADADPVAAAEDPAGRVELDRERVTARPARAAPARVSECAPRDVEHALRHQVRGAVGRDVARG